MKVYWMRSPSRCSFFNEECFKAFLFSIFWACIKNNTISNFFKLNIKLLTGSFFLFNFDRDLTGVPKIKLGTSGTLVVVIIFVRWEEEGLTGCKVKRAQSVTSPGKSVSLFMTTSRSQVRKNYNFWRNCDLFWLEKF